MKGEDMSRRALDAMDRLNKKHCQEELERINANIYPDSKIDCGNCQFNNPDAKTAFLTEMQNLLEKYDMTIGTFEGCTVPTMPYGVMFGSRYQNGDDIYVFYDMPVISSDNIFDYEKE